MSQRIRSLNHDLANTEEQTINNSLPLRIPSGTRSSTLFMASSKLVRWEVFLLRCWNNCCTPWGSRGKDQPKYLNGFTYAYAAAPSGQDCQTWAASIFDVAQHLADGNKETEADHLSLFLRGWLNNNEKFESKKGLGNYQTQNLPGRKCHPVLRIESFKVSNHSPRKIAWQSRRAKA